MSTRFAYIVTPAIIAWGKVLRPKEVREYVFVWENGKTREQEQKPCR